MTTAKQPPATPYDAELIGVYGYERQRIKGRQEGYRLALADLAPLHRQLVEALEAEANKCERCRCARHHHGQAGAIVALERCWLCAECPDWRPNEATIAALDAARKAGL